MCWHPEFGQLRRVDSEICPGCGLATTVCFERFEFERFERPAILTV
jgi:ferredoxin